MSDDNRRELNILDGLIKKKLFFRDSLKCQMDSVMLQLHKHTDFDDEFRYYTNRRLLRDAQMFSYDYASQFSQKMRMLSEKIGDGNLMAESRILSSFNMAQACLFVEALDMLKSVDLEFPNVNDSILGLYYFYYGITYQRLAVYVNDSINAKRYNNLGIEMFRKSLDYSKDQGMNNFVLGRVYGRQEKYDVAQKYFEEALKYIRKDDNILYTLANASLGKCFYHLTHNVSKYVNIAIENGEFYGMRSQITHIDKIIPDITKEKSRQNAILIVFLIATVSLFFLYILYILFRSEKNLKLLKNHIDLTEKVNSENTLLHGENESLSRANTLLRDSNRLKDAYLGKLLESNCELTNMFEEFAIKADQKLKKSQYEQVQKSIKELQKSFSKKEQLDRLDELLMSMFPTFSADFNALLLPEYRKHEGDTLLTPSMRIFALIRLGITSNHQIARVLNYSYNTILNYRVRTRAMAINADTFEQDVQEIGL